MRQPRSIRFHLASVFLVIFLLVFILGLFSISLLSNFNRLSADVAELWLPNTRALGDLNNFTSDFRAIEGSNLLSRDPSQTAAIEREMEELDRSIARSERAFERIRHDAAEAELYAQFKERWNEYRKTANEMLALLPLDHKAEAISIYTSTSRVAYNVASDTLGQLTDRAVVNAQAASDRLASAYRRAFWLIWIAITIAAIMMAGAVLYVRRVISAPLLRLAARMHRLAANDTSIDIVGTERRDEIGEMARATVVFRNNAMELIHNQGVLAEQASLLKKQLEQEQRLGLLQRNFVSMASHEFRTPLTIIDGHARRLVKMIGRMTPLEITERAAKIRGAVLRMTHLIDDLLNSSRLSDGGPGLDFSPAQIDLAVLLREICQLHREMAPGQLITEQFAVGSLQMVGDSQLLFQLFSNLLSNAIKYSPGGGAIEVRADLNMVADEITVVVADHGIGIPASDFNNLFERYHRGSNVSGIVGTGVGLYLVKIVTDLHGGKVEVESKEGEGSRFTVRLPLNSRSRIDFVSRREAISTSPEEVQLVERHVE